MEDVSHRRGGILPIAILSALLVVVVVTALVLVGSFWSQAQRARQQASAARAQVSVEGKQAAQLRAEVTALKKKAANPTVEIWNTCGGPCQVGPQQVLIGGVPDTFVLHFAFTSSAPVTLSFLTYDQWTQFANCSFDLSCVTSSYTTYGATTQQAVDFSLGAGCAGYLYVLTAAASATVTPNVSATYQPATTETGQCAATS